MGNIPDREVRKLLVEAFLLGRASLTEGGIDVVRRDYMTDAELHRHADATAFEIVHAHEHPAHHRTTPLTDDEREQVAQRHSEEIARLTHTTRENFAKSFDGPEPEE